MFRRKANIEDDTSLNQAFEDLRKGSAEAFHLLYEAYQQRIYRFCLRILGDKDAAADAFQETFIKVFEHRRDFRGSNFTSWIYTIARHTCLNVIRARKDHEEINEEFHHPVDAEESDPAMKKYIADAVAKLPVAMREALVLREYEDCSYNEIADILGIDFSLAKVRVHRARLILRKLLKPLVKEYYES